MTEKQKNYLIRLMGQAGYKVEGVDKLFANRFNIPWRDCSLEKWLKEDVEYFELSNMIETLEGE